MKPVIVFTDGASSGNPGPGGWGAVIATGDGAILELGGHAGETTNNRMEMLAAIEALKVLARIERPVVIYSDSSYLVNGITKWIKGWKRRGWVTQAREPVLNRDLWMELDGLVSDRDVHWHHVAGHAGLPGNERADRIATGFARGRPPELYCGPQGEHGVDLDAEPVAPRARPSRARQKTGKPHAYLSLVNGEWRRHATWKDCEARVKGVSGARFKKVMDEAEIDVVLRGWGVA